MRLELPKQKGKANQTKNVFFFFWNLDSPILPAYSCFLAKNFDVFFCYIVVGRLVAVFVAGTCCVTPTCVKTPTAFAFWGIFLFYFALSHFSCHTQHCILYANWFVSIQPEQGVDHRRHKTLQFFFFFTQTIWPKIAKDQKNKQSTRAQINRQRWGLRTETEAGMLFCEQAISTVKNLI